jgi:hypothetical protein
LGLILLAWAVAAFAPAQVRGLLLGTSSQTTAHVVFVLTVFVVGNAAMTLFTLSLRDAYLARARKRPESPGLRGRQFANELLTWTAGASLWSVFTALIAAGGDSAYVEALPDVIGRAVSVGIVIGLTALSPRWLLRWLEAFADVYRYGTRRDKWQMVMGTVAVAALLPVPWTGILVSS